MKIEEKRLVGNVFLSAACVSYCGLAGVFRNILIEKWRRTFSIFGSSGRLMHVKEYYW